MGKPGQSESRRKLCAPIRYPATLPVHSRAEEDNSPKGKLEFDFFFRLSQTIFLYFEMTRILMQVGQTHIHVDYLQISQLPVFKF